MHMFNQLPGRSAVVAQNVVAFGLHRSDDGPSHSAQSGAERRQDIVRAVVNPGIVLLGNQQGVPIAERADIQERQDNIILINSGRGNAAGRHPAEYALVLPHPSLCTCSTCDPERD